MTVQFFDTGVGTHMTQSALSKFILQASVHVIVHKLVIDYIILIVIVILKLQVHINPHLIICI